MGYFLIITGAIFFSSGITLPQYGEPFFTSSGKVFWQWELITGSGNALSILFPTGYTRKACFVCCSFNHLIRDCDFHEKRMAKHVELNKRKNKVTCERNDRPMWNNMQRLNHQNKFVPIEILTKTRRFPVNDARQIFFSQAASTSIVRKVNTARPIVNEMRPRNNVYKSHSPFRQPFNRTTVPKANFANHKVNTAGDKTITAVRGNRETVVKTSVENKANKTAGPKEANNSVGAARANSTNNVNTASTPVNTASTPVNTASLSRNVSAPDLSTSANQDDSQIPSLKDIYEVPNDGIFTNASYDDEDAVADFINLESTMNIETKKISQALEDKSFIDPKFPKNVDKVIKALYGLHQAPRAWYATLSTFLVQSGYRKGLIDKTLFIKKYKNDSMLVQDEFYGELTFFIGLQVKQREDGIFISHDKYVTEILKKFDFISVKTASTPIETKKTLFKDAEAADVDVHLYRSMIGSLMYLTASRPDIMYAGCACSRFQVTSNTSHLHAMKKIFRYLKGQPKLGLWYSRESAFDLEAYSDSDYAGANLDMKYTTREAEYFAAASCCGKYCGFRNEC
uniref:Reverse transcriptase Ty1/copia-type domain-containing protein n=1 Tax=Tanacetum cinerariifolium TaxID=118510 RepID=A0A6L2MUZ5_TANCI|nr:hypothetical protein [Tanacetum cinerariifolium]